MANTLVMVLIAATVTMGLMIGVTLSLQPQQAKAEPKQLIVNNHGHAKCDIVTGCNDEVGGFVENGPGAGHINCSLNSHRESEYFKCNSH
jgi:hypothetical protein